MNMEDHMSNSESKGASRLRKTIIGFAILCMAVAGYSIIEVNRQAKNDHANIQSIVDLRVKALGIAKLADDASAANDEAFDSLIGLTSEMDSLWEALQRRLYNQGEIPSTDIKVVAGSWQKVRNELKQLVDSRNTVMFVSTVANKLNAKLPQLQDFSSQVVDSLIAQSAPAGQITIAQEQL